MADIFLHNIETLSLDSGIFPASRQRQHDSAWGPTIVGSPWFEWPLGRNLTLCFIHPVAASCACCGIELEGEEVVGRVWRLSVRTEK